MEKYEKKWSSVEPGLMIFLIDQSASMREPWESKTKADLIALVINRAIWNIILQNMVGSTLKNRAYITLIGYGGKGNNSIDIINNGFLSDFADKPIRFEKNTQMVADGIGGIIEVQVETPIWLEPVANGYTPMGGAFENAKDILSKWLNKRPDAPASIIINITDGIASNGNESDPMEEVNKTISVYNDIKELKTYRDEVPLVFNVLIGGNNTKIGFPENESELGSNDIAKFLFQISSVVPEVIRINEKKFAFPIKVNSRAFIANADLIDLIEFIEFGSRVMQY
jgi:hypothetical protein